MRVSVSSIAAACALVASAGTFAQTSADRAFTATGTDCAQVVWSQEQLAKYPNIGSACKEVVQRNGKAYVKFEGEVKKVANRGETLTLDIADGDTLTVHPPENMVINMGGQKVSPKGLRPGDKLTFYVPEDRLTAQFTVDDNVPAQVAPIVETPVERVAYNPQDYDMPRTASMLPLFALTGGILVVLAAASTTRRWMRRRPGGLA